MDSSMTGEDIINSLTNLSQEDINQAMRLPADQRSGFEATYAGSEKERDSGWNWGDGWRSSRSVKTCGTGESVVKLSAEMLDSYDRCERRFAYSREWESKSISPLSLLYRALEDAIQAEDPEQMAKDVTLEVAQKSELQTGNENAFMIIRHCGFLAGIIATALQREIRSDESPTPQAHYRFRVGIEPFPRS